MRLAQLVLRHRALYVVRRADAGAGAVNNPERLTPERRTEIEISARWLAWWLAERGYAPVTNAVIDDLRRELAAVEAERDAARERCGNLEEEGIMADPIRVGGRDPFQYQKPTPEQVERIERIRGECRDLYETLMTQIRPSRERSLAITKLEEVSMWANKAIVFERWESRSE